MNRNLSVLMHGDILFCEPNSILPFTGIADPSGLRVVKRITPLCEIYISILYDDKQDTI